MLLFLSNEIVSVSKQVVGDKILDDPLRVIVIYLLMSPSIYIHLGSSLTTSSKKR